MITVIGVRFRSAGKIYYFDPEGREISRGMSVIVETARGMEMGMVMLPNTEVEDEKVVQPLKPIIRIAETEDFDVVRTNKQKEKEAFQICQEKIREHGLEMKLIDVEYTFDNNKILFYFTADGRIDFRELVKDLAYIFRTRIELRQIGVRDETKILGGYGICGRSLCCHSYLSDFVPVSIRMAKEQNLSLNPSKISGVCGRLMCCLKNEEETYEYLNSQLPKNGEMVTVTHEGVEGTVAGVSVLSQTVKVMIRSEGGEIEVKEYPVDALDFGPDRKPPIPIAAVSLPEEDPNQNSSASNPKEKNPTRRDPKKASEEREERRAARRNQRLAELDRGQAREDRSGEEKDGRERRNHPDAKENRGRRDGRGSRDNQENKENRGSRDNQENRENRGGRDSQESKENRGSRDNQEGREKGSGKGSERSSRRSRRSNRSDKSGKQAANTENRAEQEHRPKAEDSSRDREGKAADSETKPHRSHRPYRRRHGNAKQAGASKQS